MSIMATDTAARVPLKTLASKLGVASPGKPPVEVERSSSPPALTEDKSRILEDGEIEEQQGAVGSRQS
jgi:hypothetical protein